MMIYFKNRTSNFAISKYQYLGNKIKKYKFVTVKKYIEVTTYMSVA